MQRLAHPKAESNTSSQSPRIAGGDWIYRHEFSYAQYFLDALGAKQTTFQTWDDVGTLESQKHKRGFLAQILHGPFRQHAKELARLNRNGAAVTVTLNRTDLAGRTEENIKAVRAVCLDLDREMTLPEVKLLLARGRLPPHMIIESSRERWHVYWLVNKLPLEDFAGVQRRIAERFDGDPDVAKLTHCARLPGYYNNKSRDDRGPFLTRIAVFNEHQRFTAEEILAEFPPLAAAHKPPQSLAGRTELAANDPVAAATEFVATTFSLTDGQDVIETLHGYRDNFYRWAGTHYTAVETQELRRAIYEFLRGCVTLNKKGKWQPFKVTPQQVTNVIDVLKASQFQHGQKQAPFWTTGEAEPPRHQIAFGNGRLDIESGKLLPHDPRLFTLHCVPFDYAEDAPPPKRWLRFLRELWPDDLEARKCLQMVFGLLLTSDTSHHKIIIIIGPPRSGKGTIARTLTAMLGSNNVVSPTLAGISSQFGLVPLIDKSLAIVADARLQVNAHLVIERLLNISGEDAMTIDRKNREAWTGRLTTRVMILTNELPKFSDASGAMVSRLLPLIIKPSFLGREDHKLEATLQGELPGITNWALDGLDMLREAGVLTMPQSSADAMQQLADLASPVTAFIRDWCVVGPREQVPVSLLYEAFTYWSEDTGQPRVSHNIFGRNLSAAFPNLKTTGRYPDRRYVGIDLTMDADDALAVKRRARGKG